MSNKPDLSFISPLSLMQCLEQLKGIETTGKSAISVTTNSIKDGYYFQIIRTTQHRPNPLNHNSQTTVVMAKGFLFSLPENKTHVVANFRIAFGLFVGVLNLVITSLLCGIANRYLGVIVLLFLAVIVAKSYFGDKQFIHRIKNSLQFDKDAIVDLQFDYFQFLEPGRFY